MEYDKEYRGKLVVDNLVGLKPEIPKEYNPNGISMNINIDGTNRVKGKIIIDFWEEYNNKVIPVSRSLEFREYSTVVPIYDFVPYELFKDGKITYEISLETLKIIDNGKSVEPSFTWKITSRKAKPKNTITKTYGFAF